MRSENEDGERFYSSTSEGVQSHDEVEEETTSDTNLPGLRETLSLCYIGTLLLRLPLSLGDFYRYVDCKYIGMSELKEDSDVRWATQGDIVYIRAIRSIPRNMRSHLPPEYQTVLDHRKVSCSMNA